MEQEHTGFAGDEQTREQNREIQLEPQQLVDLQNQIRSIDERLQRVEELLTTLPERLTESLRKGVAERSSASSHVNTSTDDTTKNQPEEIVGWRRRPGLTAYSPLRRPKGITAYTPLFPEGEKGITAYTPLFPEGEKGITAYTPLFPEGDRWMRELYTGEDDE